MMPYRFQTQGIVPDLPSDARQHRYSLASIGLRSFMSPVVYAIRRCTTRSPIISGTDMAMLDVYRTFESKMAEFETNFSRVAYVDFPPFTIDKVKSFLAELLLESEMDLHYAARWLQGRPLFTTKFVSNILADHSRTIADQVQKYILLMTEEGEGVRSQTGQEIGEAQTPHDALVQLFESSSTVAGFDNNGKDLDLYIASVLGVFFLQYGLGKVGMPIRMPLLELGLGVVENPYNSLVNLTLEPLVLQAGYKRRNEEFWTKILDQTPDTKTTKIHTRSPDIRGTTEVGFEYVVGEILLPEILSGSLESNRYFNEIPLPEYLKGSWELPGPSFGMMADPPGPDGHGFYRWMNSVVKLENWNCPDYPRGMMFPNDACGPDVVAALLKRDPTNKQVTKIALVFVQVKLKADDADGKEAVFSVDPEMFHHTNRGLGNCTVLQTYSEEQESFIRAIEHIPVIRVLLSGGCTIKPGVVKRGSMTDVLLPIDKKQNDNATAIWRNVEVNAKRLKMTVDQK